MSIIRDESLRDHARAIRSNYDARAEALADVSGARALAPADPWQLLPDEVLAAKEAIAGAMGIGEWIEAASVAFLYSISLALEAWSVGRARRAVEQLLALTPATATLLDDDERPVPAEEVQPGARILVRPGERVPLDGIVREGASGVDQSPLTGESLPVGKQAGDEVYAGSINGEGALVVETIFLIPGLGTATVEAILREDFPVVLAVVMIVSVAFVLLNLIVDILYSVIDPRVRAE